jgi:hypothetical protein
MAVGAELAIASHSPALYEATPPPAYTWVGSRMRIRCNYLDYMIDYPLVI